MDGKNVYSTLFGLVRYEKDRSEKATLHLTSSHPPFPFPLLHLLSLTSTHLFVFPLSSAASHFIRRLSCDQRKEYQWALQSQRQTERTEDFFKTLRWMQRKGGFTWMWIAGAMNMNVSSGDGGVYCRKSARNNFHHTTSTSLPPSVSLRFNLSLSLHPCCFPFNPPTAVECKEVSALTRGVLLPGDSVISLSLSLSPSISISIPMPSIGNTVEQYWRSIKKPLSLSPSTPLASSCPSPSSWFENLFSMQEKAQKTSLLHTDFTAPSWIYLSCFSLDNRVLKSLRLTLYSFCLVLFFNLNVLPSRWIPYSAKQQVCGVYAPSGPAGPPRQTEGNLHCLNPDLLTSPSPIHGPDPPPSWLLPPPGFIITCNRRHHPMRFSDRRASKSCYSSGAFEELVSPQSWALVSAQVSNLF